MPALPAVPKVIRLDFQGIMGGANIRNRTFVQYTGTLSPADLATWLGTVSTQYGTWVSAIQNQTFVLTQITGTDLSSASAPQAINTTTRTGTRTTTTPLSNGVALVIKFRIARRYRGGHPKYFLAGLNVPDMSSPDSWTGGLMTLVGTNWNNFVSGIIGTVPVAMGVLSHVNVSYFQGFRNVTFPSGRTRPEPVLRGTPLVDPVETYSVNPRPASQRRRNGQ